jgi:hypothetical protein
MFSTFTLSRAIDPQLRHERTVMTAVQATRTKASSAASPSSRLFLLELSDNRIHSMNPDGSDRKTIVTNCHLPEGIVVDAAGGHVYWTNMGILNLDLDGGNRKPRCRTPAVSAYEGIAAAPASDRRGSSWTQSRRWMFGRIFGLDGRESYRELRREPLCCPHRPSRETA